MGRADWRETLAALDLRGATIFHLAARVHESHAEDAAFDRDNVDKTRMLAEAAAAGGAARLVFASSVKVLGEESGARPYGDGDEANPGDAYARSKWRAEQALREVTAHSGLPVVTLRIPLTYGPGAGGNFRALVRLADSGWWLPFGAIENRRSFVHVDDLVEALLLSAAHPEAPGKTYLVAHPEPVSTARLVESMRAALARPRRLFAVAPALLEFGASAFGLGARMRRLTRSLEVDPSSLIRELGWRPGVALDAGIRASLRSSAT